MDLQDACRCLQSTSTLHPCLGWHWIKRLPINQFLDGNTVLPIWAPPKAPLSRVRHQSKSAQENDVPGLWRSTNNLDGAKKHANHEPAKNWFYPSTFIALVPNSYTNRKDDLQKSHFSGCIKLAIEFSPSPHNWGTPIPFLFPLAAHIFCRKKFSCNSYKYTALWKV